MGPAVPSSLQAAVARSQAFHDWEIKGRGWTVWPYPVALEPVFESCQLYDTSEVEDDGRVKTIPEHLLSGLAWAWKRLRHSRQPAGVVAESDLPKAYVDREELVALQLMLPADFSLNPDLMQRVLLSLPNRQAAMTMELLASSDSLSLSLLVREPELRATKQQLAAHLPGVAVSQVRDQLGLRWTELRQQGSLVLDFALSQEFMCPLQRPRSYEPDPLIALLAALSDLDQDELAVLQIQFQRCNAPWADEAMNALVTPTGQPFFADAPQMLPLAREKLSTPLFAVVIRLGCKTGTQDRAWSIAQSVWRGLEAFSQADSNSLIPLDPASYEPEAMEADLLLRQSRRTGMLLGTDELAALCHLPGRSVVSDKLLRISSKTRQAPEVCFASGLSLGVNVHAGVERDAFLPDGLRSRHVHLVGASGTGKSTLMLNMALQDLESGNGLCVVDPHGDLIDELLARMPEKRHKDLVLVDPSDLEYSVGFNVLSARNDLEKQLLSSDLVASFKRLSTSWGDQMTSVLGNAVLAFLESSEGGTLADLRRFLVEKEFRKRFLSTVQDEEVQYFWNKEFPLLSGRPQAPLLTRLDTFLRHRLVRQMVAQKRSSFDLREVMDKQGVLLIRLSQGAIGEENAALLGTLFVSRLQQAAQSRQELPERDRTLFTVYLDEFHNYLCPSMASILSGGRKYGLGLVLAHQDLSQLGKREAGILGAAISNPATRICFRLGDSDARKLADGFSHFDSSDLQSLGVGQAICRVSQADKDFNLSTEALDDIGEQEAARSIQRATQTSRNRHSRLRTEIAEELAKARGAAVSPDRQQSAEPSSKMPPDTEPPLEKDKIPTPLPQATREPEARIPESASEPGRGGSLHKYWQRLVRELAQRHGWKARVEGKLEAGGFVDVLIERGEKRLAVEVGMGTDVKHELENLQKCLDAGFDLVAGLYAEPATLAAMKRVVKKEMKPAQRKRLLLGTPEQVLGQIHGILRSPKKSATRTRGYVVKVESDRRSQDLRNEEELSAFITRAWKGPGGK